MERANVIDPIDVYVGERLLIARKMCGLSQEYLGSCIGLSYQQIQKYEKASNRISASKLAWFARLLGVPVHFFFQGLPTEYHDGGLPVAPTDELPAVEKDVLFRDETYKLINLYYAIQSQEKRGVILEMLKVMALHSDR